MLTAAGSGSARTLPSERDIPLLAELGRAYDAQPAWTKLVETQRGGHIVQVAVHQRNAGRGDSILVFVHGILSDHTSYRYLAGALGPDREVWLVDLPGCGASDRPNPKKLELDAFTPTAMAERVLAALEGCLAERAAAGLPDRDLHLVGHSLGGMTVLRMLGDPDLRSRFPRVLSHVRDAVLLSPCDAELHAAVPVFLQVLDLKGWQVAVGGALGVLRQRAVESTLASYHTPDRATAESAETFIAIVSDAGQRRAAQAMMRQAVPWHEKTRRPDWPAMARLSRQHANVAVPCLIVWGQWDEILPASMGHKLKDEIPGSKLTKLSGCGHFIPSEQPLETARLIRDFMTDEAVTARSTIPQLTSIPAHE